MSWTEWRRLLATYLAPHRRLAVLVGAALLATTGLQIVTPQLLRGFVDAATARSGRSLGFIALVYVAAVLIQQATRLAAAWMGEVLGWLTTNELRADLMRHCLRLDLSFHKSRTPGEMIERVDGDMNGISLFFGQVLLSVVGSVLLLIGVLIAVWLENSLAGAVLTVFAVGGLGAMVVIRRVSASAWEQSRQASAMLFGLVEEQLAGTEDLRSCGAEPYAFHGFYRRARDRTWSIRRARMLDSVPGSVNGLVAALANAVAFTVPAYLVTRGSITLGTAFVVYFYTQILIQPLATVSQQVQQLQQAIAGGRRVMELMRIRPAIVDGPLGELAPGALPVSLREVTFGYDDEPPVLHQVSLEVAAGSVVGLVGRTGSGKSSLARLLVRLYDPREGVIELGGVDLRQLELSCLRRRVAMVNQEVRVLRASVRENLTLFDPAIGDEAVEAALGRLGLAAWVDRLPRGVDTVVGEDGIGLSAGQAQLLALGRAFLADPSVVILDEAASRMDPATEHFLEGAMDALLEGRTGIVIAHRLATLDRCDQICILEHGRVVETGDRQSLADDPHSRFGALLRRGLDLVA